MGHLQSKFVEIKAMRGQLANLTAALAEQAAAGQAAAASPRAPK